MIFSRQLRGGCEVKLACSIEEMQDLVSTLKDACLSAKRNEKTYS